jgi:AcrR family transcriptional regulator
MADPAGIERARELESGAGLSRTRSRTRRRLLRAAAVVFAEKSVLDATVEDVLREAGVSRGTFYHFFSDKLALLAALYANAVDRLHARRVEATAGATSGVDCLLRGFEVYTGFHATSAPLVRALASEALRPESPLGPIRDALIERTIDFYTRRFEELEGRPIDPGAVRALVLMSDALHLHMLKTTDASAADIERVRAILRPILERVLA